MTRVSRITCLLLMVATVCVASEPQVDVDEVIRRGDSVTRTGDGIQAGEEQLIGESLALPADDSHKWFVILFTQKNCAACDQLKRDWAQSPQLQAWAKPTDPKQSWAHFSEVRAEDATQQWRLQAYKITSFPTLVIQPPRTQDYGDPATVVMQRAGYDGKPDKLAGAMSTAMKDYGSKLFRAGKTQLASGYRQVAGGYDPPYSPPPSYPSFYPAGPMGPYGPAIQIPPGPVAATIDQLRAACPGADSDFLVQQLQLGATIEQAQQAWRIKQAALQPMPTTPATPTPGIPTPGNSILSYVITIVLTLLTGGGSAGVLALILKALTNKTAGPSVPGTTAELKPFDLGGTIAEAIRAAFKEHLPTSKGK